MTPRAVSSRDAVWAFVLLVRPGPGGGRNLYACWGRLPKIPPMFIGHTYLVQVLCWEKTGKAHYSVSNPVRLVVVPE